MHACLRVRTRGAGDASCSAAAAPLSPLQLLEDVEATAADEEGWTRMGSAKVESLEEIPAMDDMDDAQQPPPAEEEALAQQLTAALHVSAAGANSSSSGGGDALQAAAAAAAAAAASSAAAADEDDIPDMEDYDEEEDDATLPYAQTSSTR
eukprot:scaffold4737_cov371-Prasinococcus_capsulatus_cf.AAC.8